MIAIKATASIDCVTEYFAHIPAGQMWQPPPFLLLRDNTNALSTDAASGPVAFVAELPVHASDLVDQSSVETVFAQAGWCTAGAWSAVPTGRHISVVPANWECLVYDMAAAARQAGARARSALAERDRLITAAADYLGVRPVAAATELSLAQLSAIIANQTAAPNPR